MKVITLTGVIGGKMAGTADIEIRAALRLCLDRGLCGNSHKSIYILYLS